MSKAKWQNIAGSKKKFNSGDEEQNDADEEGIVIDDYDDFEEEEEDTEKGHNKKKSSIVLSTDIQKKTGARNRISIDFDTTKTTKEIPKGQLNFEWIYEVIVSPEMQTKNYKDFCPTKQTRSVAKKSAYTHQKITKKSATILVCMVGQKSL